MARSLYGGRGGDFVTSTSGALMPGDTGTVWTAKTGGTQVTDLLDESGNALATTGVIVAGAHGEVTFQGPDGTTSGLWVDFGGGIRVLVDPRTTIGGGGGTVTSVTAGNGTITVAGTATDPTIAATVGTTSGTVAAGDDSRITGAVQKSTATTKGDILAATASATITRLGVGTNDHVLTADSTTATGLKWAAVAGGVSSVNSETGAVTLTTDDISDAGQTNKWTTAGDISKLAGIEAAADVTDATNVAAAGAVMATLADAKGDLIVATAADTLTRLAVGTNDYVLTADSAQATGVKWAAASGGSGIAATLLDAKGDLIAASAADTAAKVTVGANGLTLTADSTASAGVAWKATAPTAGLSLAASMFFTATNVCAVGTVGTNELLTAIPVRLSAGITLAELLVYLSSTGGAGTVCRLGVYADSGSFTPGALALDAGTVATSSGTGIKSITGLSTALSAGVWWLAACVQVASSSPPALYAAKHPTQSASAPPLAYMGRNAANAGYLFGNDRYDIVIGYSQAGVSGALPNPFTGTTAIDSNTGAILVAGRVAS